MNTKIIMTSSAITLGIAGVILVFLPAEVLKYFDIGNNNLSRLFIQILGSFYYSFAILNWMTRTSIIGGIYNKPLALANFIFYFISGLTLIKNIISDHNLPLFIWITAFLYTLFAFAFGFILFRHPSNINNSN